MRLRTYTLTREDADRLAYVLTRHGGERTLRDLERRHRFWPHMIEAAAAAGVVCIEIRQPATGRPSRVAVLHAEMVNKTPSAKLPLFSDQSAIDRVAGCISALPRRRDLPVPLTIREELFLMNYWCRNGIGGGFFGPRGLHSAADAYWSVYGQGGRLKWASAKSAGARLARRPWMRAAWLLSRRLSGCGQPFRFPDDMRSAGRGWRSLIQQLDRKFFSWPPDVTYALRHTRTLPEALERLRELGHFGQDSPPLYW